MTDDSDLLIAAAATAAVFTWMATRKREGGAGRRRDWRALLKATGAGIGRCWRETPAYLFYQGIRDALSRKR